jgi:uncharacterized protein YabN with tetrapyrrole methylase and pyrophosphatase domain
VTEARALTVVGTGIRCGVDLARDARAALADADDVFFIAADPISHAVMHKHRPDAVSLGSLYGQNVERQDTYARIVDRVLDAVRAGRRVCFAVPGHPAVFAQPTHEAIRRARAEGFEAVMLPALSAADHLYADLGVDPGAVGSASFDATDFIVHGRRADPTTALLLWQIGAIGETCEPSAVNRDGLRVLTEVLLEGYPPAHEVVVYEAARYAITDPVVSPVRLDELPSAPVSFYSTLYVPPASTPPLVPERLARLRLTTVPA